VVIDQIENHISFKKKQPQNILHIFMRLCTSYRFVNITIKPLSDMYLLFFKLMKATA